MSRVPQAYLALLIYGADKLQRFARGVASKRRVQKAETVRADHPPHPTSVVTTWQHFPSHPTLLGATWQVANGEILRLSILRPSCSYPQLGQYVFLNFPEISRWEWHPYTLASSPLEEHYEVDIKGLGDHTKKLLAACTGGSKPICRVDGPYGRVVINPKRYRSVVLVGGGIGVTPMVSMLRWFYLINVCPTPFSLQPHSLSPCPEPPTRPPFTVLLLGARTPALHPSRL